MNRVTRSNATVAFLAVVLLLGGASAAGFTGNFLLQLLGAGLIGWTLWSRDAAPPLAVGLRPFFIALAVLALVQFVLLPPGLWSALPGREAIYKGFGTLGVPAPWLTLSLAPWHSLASFAWWIPAAALFVAMRAADAPPARLAIWTIAAVASVSVAFGAMQAGAGQLYFYTITNFGAGPGFFANSNHQGSFLLAALALYGGWLIGSLRAPGRKVSWFAGPQMAQVAVGVLLLFGVAVSNSLACLLLLGPVLIGLLFAAKPEWRLPVPLALLGILVVVGGFAAFLLLDPATNDLAAKGVLAGISRQEFLVTGSRIVRDFAPLGSGMGTFLELYRWYENPAIVGGTFVNHAHDDLLELLIETGIFGLVAVLAFLAWYVPRAWALWSGPRRNPIQLGASLVIGVELIHSLVDYPLRTAAMSSVMAIACVLLVRPAEAMQSSRSPRRRSTVAKAEDMIRI